VKEPPAQSTVLCDGGRTTPSILISGTQNEPMPSHPTGKGGSLEPDPLLVRGLNRPEGRARGIAGMNSEVRARSCARTNPHFSFTPRLASSLRFRLDAGQTSRETPTGSGRPRAAGGAEFGGRHMSIASAPAALWYPRWCGMVTSRIGVHDKSCLVCEAGLARESRSCHRNCVMNFLPRLRCDERQLRRKTK
jgi:hypothetical protein